MSIAPVGIVNAGDPRQAYQDGFNVASVNQDGFNRDAAAAVAAGVAEALSPEASVESVIGAIENQASDAVFRAVDRARGVAEESETIDEFVERFYDELLDWRWPAVEWDRELYEEGRVFSADSAEILPAAVGVLELCEGDVDRSIVEAASFGRDCDTIAAVVGNLTGALRGAENLRDEWVEVCESANAEFFEEVHGHEGVDFETTSERLVEALENERRRAGKREETLDEML
jgi:ADP-ribosylglycohydrolase